jgi:predicted regulator of Ras-like GTPase activity (Roadblock/LC7/MglB family)
MQPRVLTISDDSAETLDDILKKLLASIPEVKAACIVSVEGLPIASALPRNVDETRVAAMTAAMLSLGERAAQEFEKGDMEQVYVRGVDGYILVMSAGPNAVLTVSATKDVKLGLIFLDCKRACEKISKLV